MNYIFFNITFIYKRFCLSYIVINNHKLPSLKRYFSNQVQVHAIQTFSVEIDKYSRSSSTVASQVP
jgi:hypothetical protein